MSDSGLYECQVSYHDDVEKKLTKPVKLLVLGKTQFPGLWKKKVASIALTAFSSCTIRREKSEPTILKDPSDWNRPSEIQMHLQLLDIYINAYKIFFWDVYTGGISICFHTCSTFLGIISIEIGFISWIRLVLNWKAHFVVYSVGDFWQKPSRSHRSVPHVSLDFHHNWFIDRYKSISRSEGREKIQICICLYFTVFPEREGRGGVKNHSLLTLLSSKALNNVSS